MRIDKVVSCNISEDVNFLLVFSHITQEQNVDANIICLSCGIVKRLNIAYDSISYSTLHINFILFPICSQQILYFIHFLLSVLFCIVGKSCISLRVTFLSFQVHFSFTPPNLFHPILQTPSVVPYINGGVQREDELTRL